TCLPKDLPEYIEVDIAELDIGETIHLSQLTLPAGVEITAILHGGDAELAVVQVNAPRGPSADDEAEAGEGETGGEG
ncbi:MAG: 50S ribosomal protein L25, partial [Gammaproteobacteria bacterium]